MCQLLIIRYKVGYIDVAAKLFDENIIPYLVTVLSFLSKHTEPEARVLPVDEGVVEAELEDEIT